MMMKKYKKHKKHKKYKNMIIKKKHKIIKKLN